MKIHGLLAVCLAGMLSGCAMPAASTSTSPAPSDTSPLFTSVAPSAAGTPNSAVSLGNYEFVSVQGTGQIFTYNISSGSPVQVGQPYATPCTSPSGMVIAAIAGSNVMAVPCYDTGSLLTLTVHTNGSLSALGSVSGLPKPYPGIVLDGTNVYVPLFGASQVANGGVARVSLAVPALPVVTGLTMLASPSTGGFVNPGYLAAAGGYLYAAAGSEDPPLVASSNIQVLNESTMALVGSPFVVDHSPQQIAVSQGTAFVTSYDAGTLQAIDISNPAGLRSLQVFSLGACAAYSVLVRENFAYVGCYAQGVVDRVDISDPTNMRVSAVLTGLSHPQRIDFSPLHYLMVTDSEKGGSLYQIDAGRF